MCCLAVSLLRIEASRFGFEHQLNATPMWLISLLFAACSAHVCLLWRPCLIKLGMGAPIFYRPVPQRLPRTSFMVITTAHDRSRMRSCPGRLVAAATISRITAVVAVLACERTPPSMNCPQLLNVLRGEMRP